MAEGELEVKLGAVARWLDIRAPKVQPGMIVQWTRRERIRQDKEGLPPHIQRRLIDLEQRLATTPSRSFAYLELQRDIEKLRDQFPIERTTTCEALVLRVEPQITGVLFGKHMDWTVTLEGLSGKRLSDEDLEPLRWSQYKPAVLQDETFTQARGAYVILTQSALEESSLVYVADAKNRTLFAVSGSALSRMLTKKERKLPELGIKIQVEQPANADGRTRDGTMAEAAVGIAASNAERVQRVREPKITDLRDPKAIAAHMDTVVRGQRPATEAMAVAISDHQRRTTGIKKSNALIVGPTGCGKTELSRLAAELMGVPFAEAKMASKTRSGYKGDNLATVFEDLIGERHKPGFERSVVLLDEIDKTTSPQGGGEPDFFGPRLQNELIGWVESAMVPVPLSIHQTVKLDTTDMLFIGAGAFVGLDKIIARRLGKGEGCEIPIQELYAEVLPEDLEQFGFKPELIGRFPIITYVRPLNEDDLVDIMQRGEKSVVRQQLRLLQEGYGVEVVLEEGVYRLIARAALPLGTGARGLETVCNRLFQDMKLNIRDLTAGGKTRISVDEGMARQRLGRLLAVR